MPEQGLFNIRLLHGFFGHIVGGAKLSKKRAFGFALTKTGRKLFDCLIERRKKLCNTALCYLAWVVGGAGLRTAE